MSGRCNKVSILVGFKYHGGYHNRKTLPSTEIDLYLMYKKALAMNSDRIVVVTDLTSNPSPSKYIKMIVKGELEDKILDFIDTLKSRSQYLEYKSKGQMVEIVKEALASATRVFFYASCHGLEENLLLPGADVLTATELRMLSIPRCSNLLSCFIVIDCCESSDLSLPLVLRNHDYRTNTLDGVTEARVILLTSSRRDSRSLSQLRGSKFTVDLLKAIEATDDVRQIVDRVSSTSTISVFSTFPEFKLWRWIYGFSINTYIEDNCIVIERV